jgi:hypothetical protein
MHASGLGFSRSEARNSNPPRSELAVSNVSVLATMEVRIELEEARLQMFGMRLMSCYATEVALAEDDLAAHRGNFLS